MNLAKERKTRARALSAAVDELVTLMMPFAEQQGVDLRTQLAELRREGRKSSGSWLSGFRSPSCRCS
jgi:hypothetical protein